MSRGERVMVKIVVLGNANVGKSSIIKRYSTGVFQAKRQASLGTDFSTNKMKINGEDIVVQLWDTAGMERFHQSGVLGEALYRGADGALIVYDVNDEHSIADLSNWRDEAVHRADPEVFFPVVVIGNKVDLAKAEQEDRKGSESNLKKLTDSSAAGKPQMTADLKKLRANVVRWCREYQYGHIETSALDGSGIEAAMACIVSLALEYQRARVHLGRSIQRERVSSATVKLSRRYSPKKPSSSCC